MAFATSIRLPRRLAAIGLFALATWHGGAALAWSVTIQAAGPRVYLHVGKGAPDSTLATVNLVSIDVTPAQLYNGVPLPMSSNSTQSNSLNPERTNFLVCPTPDSQVLVGASYRRNNSSLPSSATLRVTSPANLTSAAGGSIPFSQIGWAVSAPGSPSPNIIPAGHFIGGTQTLAVVPANTYIENCHSFFYVNNVQPRAGTYVGSVSYTLSAP